MKASKMTVEVSHGPVLRRAVATLELAAEVIDLAPRSLAQRRLLARARALARSVTSDLERQTRAVRRARERGGD